MTLSVYTDPHRLDDDVVQLVVSSNTIDKEVVYILIVLNDVCTIVVVLLPLTKEVVYILIV